MTVLMKPIEMIAVFSKEGVPTPIKFKFNEGPEPVVVKVDRITDRSMDRTCGNPMLVFLCESTINDVLKSYEIKYELTTCIWYLSKI